MVGAKVARLFARSPPLAAKRTVSKPSRWACIHGSHASLNVALQHLHPKLEQVRANGTLQGGAGRKELFTAAAFRSCKHCLFRTVNLVTFGEITRWRFCKEYCRMRSCIWWRKEVSLNPGLIMAPRLEDDVRLCNDDCRIFDGSPDSTEAIRRKIERVCKWIAGTELASVLQRRFRRTPLSSFHTLEFRRNNRQHSSRRRVSRQIQRSMDVAQPKGPSPRCPGPRPVGLCQICVASRSDRVL